MKSRTWMWTTAACLFAALAIPVGFAAQDNPDHQPTFTTFDAPGAGTGAFGGTFPSAINVKGAITGFYVNASRVFHGFLRDCDRERHEKHCESGDDTIITFDVPGAGLQGTVPTAINAEGAITGSYADTNNLTHGFLRAPDGTFTTFDAPGAGGFFGTNPASINPEGAIMGNYTDASNVYHGFLRAPDGTITTFDFPGAGAGFLQGTSAFGMSLISFGSGGINPAGVIGTSYIDASDMEHGLLRARDGTFTTFDVPGAGTGAHRGTSVDGINPAGAVTGVYFQPIFGDPFSGNYRGFLRNPDGTFSTFDAATPPCCRFTNPQAINPGGAITGYYNDGDTGNSTFHSFLRARNGTITTFDAPGAGTGTSRGTLAFAINPAGAITGYYIDSKTVAHGFLWTKACDRDDHEEKCGGDE